MTTDRDHLLRAFRRGDSRALFPLADLWLEQGCEKQAAEFDRLIRRFRWSLSAKRAMKNRRVSPAENCYRSLLYFVVRVNRLERCWRLPAVFCKTPAEEWLREASGHLMTYVRERMAAESQDAPQEPVPDLLG